MKRIPILVLSFALLLSGCSDGIKQEENTDTKRTEYITETEGGVIGVDAAQVICRHSYERIENINKYTAADKCQKCGATRMYTDSESITVTEGEADFRMIRHYDDGYGTHEKDIPTCDLAYAMTECISELDETGEIIPAVSDKSMEEVGGYLPTKPGTLWLEFGSRGLYRIDSRTESICRVETHFGEGVALEMTDTLKTLLRQAWYYPRDTWSGRYEDGNVTLNQVYKNDSMVEWVAVENIHVENKIDSRNNSITLRICAKESGTVKVSFESYQSDDNLGSGGEKTVKLIKGEEVTVNFTFYGFYNYTYWISASIDNTRIEMTVNPTGAQ